MNNGAIIIYCSFIVLSIAVSCLVMIATFGQIYKHELSIGWLLAFCHHFIFWRIVEKRLNNTSQTELIPTLGLTILCLMGLMAIVLWVFFKTNLHLFPFVYVLFITYGLFLIHDVSKLYYLGKNR